MKESTIISAHGSFVDVKFVRLFRLALSYGRLARVEVGGYLSLSEVFVQ